MRITIRRNPTLKIKFLLFLFLVIAYCLTTSDSSEQGSSFLKYLVLSLCIIHGGCLYYGNRKYRKNKHFRNEFNGLMVFVGLIVLYSIVRSLLASHFSFRTVQELIFLVCPMVYAYFVINTWTKDEIDTAMRCGLIISLYIYVLSLGMNFQSIYHALISSNFGESYSELESFAFCGFALAFCTYFCYYNKNKIYTILSVLFVIMTFKRLFIVMAVILLILGHFKVRDNKILNKSVWISIISLFVFAVLYYHLLLPESVVALENRYNIDISALTSTRSDRLRWLVNSTYQTYGFGSSTEFMYARFYRALEMDAAKIIIELGYIPLMAMMISYVKSGKSNLYVFVFMIFELLNLILSSGLTGTFAWSIIFISIASIQSYPNIEK